MKFFGESKPKMSDVYAGLRLQTLQGSRETFGIAAVFVPTQPWGVVMDWGLDNGFATVVALSDGNTSVYLSGGGGSLGGGQSHERIRRSVQDAVNIDEKVPASHGTVRDVSGHLHALSALGDAMQQIITQCRRIQQ